MMNEKMILSYMHGGGKEYKYCRNFEDQEEVGNLFALLTCFFAPTLQISYFGANLFCCIGNQNSESPAKGTVVGNVFCLVGRRCRPGPLLAVSRCRGKS